MQSQEELISAIKKLKEEAATLLGELEATKVLQQLDGDLSKKIEAMDEALNEPVAYLSKSPEDNDPDPIAKAIKAKETLSRTTDTIRENISLLDALAKVQQQAVVSSKQKIDDRAKELGINAEDNVEELIKAHHKKALTDATSLVTTPSTATKEEIDKALEALSTEMLSAKESMALLSQHQSSQTRLDVLKSKQNEYNGYLETLAPASPALDAELDALRPKPVQKPAADDDEKEKEDATAKTTPTPSPKKPKDPEENFKGHNWAEVMQKIMDAMEKDTTMLKVRQSLGYALYHAPGAIYRAPGNIKAGAEKAIEAASSAYAYMRPAPDTQKQETAALNAATTTEAAAKVDAEAARTTEEATSAKLNGQTPG